MTIRFGRWAATIFALSLAACGGGSGGSSPTSNPGGGWLTFNPVAPSGTQFEGESMAVSVTATASRSFSAPFNVAIVDGNGVVTTEVGLTALSDTSFLATLHTAATLTAGAHSTSLEVRVCEDSPLVCAKPFPGSPWHVPLTVQVKPKAEAAARLKISTPSVSVTTFPGEAASFKIEAQLNAELAERTVYIGVFDPASLIVPPPSRLTINRDGYYAFDIATATANNLAPGTYTSNLQLRMCEDDITTCRRPVAGSPWSIPFTLTVKTASNLSTLTDMPGLSSWSTYQGNAAHTGFANASFDPAAFSRRWSLEAPDKYGQRFSSSAIDDGRAFYVRRDAANGWQLVAVSESTGTTAWTVKLGQLSQVNPPAAANGRVYMTSSGHEDSFLWIFDQATGKQLKKLPMSSQWPSYSAPTLLGSDVYTLNGYYGGVGKYGDDSGAFKWDIGLVVNEGWSPAVDGRFAYVYSLPANQFYALDAANGSTAYMIGASYPYSTYFTSAPVVLTGTGQAIVNAGNLTAFDLATHTRKWVVNTPTFGHAAYGNDTVYAFGANGKTLEARAPATGDLLWTTADLGASFSEVIVTRNLAFVSSATSTLAIDLATHAVVWTYPKGGTLAISRRGVLYILTDSGGLSAVNLR